MQNKIEQINQAILAKQERLKEKANNQFAAIVLPTIPTTQSSPNASPVLSKVLYAGAALGVVAMLLAGENKLLYGACATASAVGGYLLHTRSKDASRTHASNIPTLNSLKVQVVEQMIAIVKKTTNEWEDFITLQQQSLHNSIAASNLTNERKEAMRAATFTYKIIDISTASISSMIDAANSVGEIKQQIKAYQTKLIAAIDSALQAQIARYTDLLR